MMTLLTKLSVVATAKTGAIYVIFYKLNLQLP